MSDKDYRMTDTHVRLHGSDVELMPAIQERTNHKAARIWRDALRLYHDVVLGRVVVVPNIDRPREGAQ